MTKFSPCGHAKNVKQILILNMTNAGEKINFMRTDTKRKVVLDMEIIVVLTYNYSKLLDGMLLI
jgi:hypothetical protein